MWVGATNIFSGPMTIRSRTNEAMWQEGWFSLIVPDIEFTLMSDLLEPLGYEAPFVDPDDFWAYKLELNTAEQGRPGYGGDST
jgi:hypothetical protein